MSNSVRFLIDAYRVAREDVGRAEALFWALVALFIIVPLSGHPKVENEAVVDGGTR